MKTDTALVFAAGLGTRLRPLTDSMPKAMVPLAGKPLIFHVINKLSKAGIGHFVVNVHHFPQQIEKYLSEEPLFGGLDIRISREDGFPRETGGGIFFAKELLGGKPFLIHNVDILSNLSVESFCSAAKEDDLSLILVSERETARYLLFDEKGERLLGWTNISTGAVKTPYPGLDVSKCRKLAFSGVHFAGKGMIAAMEEINANPSDYPLWDENGNVIPSSKEPFGEAFSIIDFYLRSCRKWTVRPYSPSSLKILDIGKKETLAVAEDFLRSVSQ